MSIISTHDEKPSNTIPMCTSHNAMSIIAGESFDGRVDRLVAKYHGQFLQGKTLVIGHGRKHQVIREVNYDNSLFVDINKNCQPDIVADIRLIDLKDQYENIVFSACETAVLNVEVSPINWENDTPFTRNRVNTDVLAKLSSWITDTGHLYLKAFIPVYKRDKISLTDRDRNLISSLSGYFKHVGEKYFTFGQTQSRLFMFQKMRPLRSP
jgi:hypothetical protein